MKQGNNTGINMRRPLCLAARRAGRLLCILVIASSLCACGRISAYRESKAAAEEESRLQVIHEMGERNREFHERRSRVFRSAAYQAALEYVDAALDELVPGCERNLGMEPRGYLLHAEESAFHEAMENPLENVGDYRTFFAQMELAIYVNFWDYDLEPKDLCQSMVDRGISGSMAADEFSGDTWEFDAVSGNINYYRMPGY